MDRAYEIDDVSIDDLLLAPSNPRLTGVGATQQEDILQALLKDRKTKLGGLIAHIAENGLNPAYRFSVVREGEGGKYTMIDGNRRLASLLYLKDCEKYAEYLKPTRAMKAFWAESPVDEWECVIFDSLENGMEWAMTQHSGELEGVGHVPWDPISQANVATALMDELGLNKTHYKGKATTINRFFDKSFVQQYLGISYEGRELRRMPQGERERDNIVRVINRLRETTSRAINRKEDIRNFLDREVKGKLGIPRAKRSVRAKGAARGRGSADRGPLNRIERDPEVQGLLEAAGNEKLYYLYQDVVGMSKKKQTAARCVVFWTFIDGLAVWHGRGDTPVTDYVKAQMTEGARQHWQVIGPESRRGVVLALESMRQYANTTKHDAWAALMDRGQFINGYKVLLPVIRALLKDIANP